MRVLAFFAIPLAFGLTAPAFAQEGPSPVPSRPAHTTVTLKPQNGSGESGTATLSDTAKGLLVKLQLTPAPTQPQPAHIHKGTCEKLNPAPAYPLTPVAKGVSTTTISGVTLAQLTSGQYAINVHKSATAAKIYVACGDIK